MKSQLGHDSIRKRFVIGRFLHFAVRNWRPKEASTIPLDPSLTRISDLKGEW